MRYRLTNNLTGGQYEFTADNAESLAAWLAQHVRSYGRTAWTETKPAWTETKPAWTDDSTTPPTEHPEEIVEHPEEIVEHPADHTIVEVDESPARIAAAWATADAAANAGADQNARARYLAWLIDPACPQSRKDKIIAVQAWMDAIWTSYAIYKANPVGAYTLPSDPCPHDFWSVANG